MHKTHPRGLPLPALRRTHHVLQLLQLRRVRLLRVGRRRGRTKAAQAAGAASQHAHQSAEVEASTWHASSACAAAAWEGPRARRHVWEETSALQLLHRLLASTGSRCWPAQPKSSGAACHWLLAGCLPGNLLGKDLLEQCAHLAARAPSQLPFCSCPALQPCLFIHPAPKGTCIICCIACCVRGSIMARRRCGSDSMERICSPS